VARAAATRGLRAIVYMRESVSPERVAAIRAEGAEVVLVNGTYDDAVKRMADAASRAGWTIVSDTAWPGYEAIPRDIMLGYTWIMTEAEGAWAPGRPPAVVVVQAGVGGLAGAVASWLCSRFGAERPYLICAEPLEAACVLASIEAGEPRSIAVGRTEMGGLRSGQMSSISWTSLRSTVDACIAIDDGSVTQTIDRLAKPLDHDPVISAGPSGACGLAALLAWMNDAPCAASRRAAGLTPDARALVINTERGVRA